MTPGGTETPIVSAVTGAARGDVGIGLRAPLVDALLAEASAVGYVELRVAEFLDVEDAAAQDVLRRVRARYPVSLHGARLAWGSAAGPGAEALARLADLIERAAPVRICDELDLARGVPAPAFTDAALAHHVANLTRVQERLRRQVLIENAWSFGAAGDGVLTEPEFFASLCRRSGCAMLLDVNTVMVNALNAGASDPLAHGRAFIDALPIGIVGEIQVGGYAEIGENGEVGEIVIADRGSRVRPAVWQLCAHALRRFGPLPVLVKWDVDLPSLEALLDEATHAARLSNR